MTVRLLSGVFAVALGAGACSPPVPPREPAVAPVASVDAAAPATVVVPSFDAESRPYALSGPLIPATTTMVSAWDIPANPLTDPSLDDSAEGERIRWGFRLFVNTPAETPRLAPSRMSCGNCHLNAGQRELALPLIGSAGMYPEYNRREGRDFTLEDRIVGCFMRSENAAEGLEVLDGPASDLVDTRAVPDPASEEVMALAAYIRWLSRDFAIGENPRWRNKNRIPEENLIAVDRLDPEVGEALFIEHCAQCHGEDGQGVQIADKKAGPLWGPHSWNDGAGAARVYTLAGMIRYTMPYLAPGVLTDEEAQHVAAFITSKPRPIFPFKDQDYQTEPRPVDAVYYDR